MCVLLWRLLAHLFFLMTIFEFTIVHLDGSCGRRWTSVVSGSPVGLAVATAPCQGCRPGFNSWPMYDATLCAFWGRMARHLVVMCFSVIHHTRRSPRFPVRYFLCLRFHPRSRLRLCTSVSGATRDGCPPKPAHVAVTRNQLTYISFVW